VERHGAILNLSEAQRLYVDHMYQLYLDACRDLENRYRPRVEAATKPLLERPLTGYVRDARALQDDQAFCETENSFCLDLAKADEMFMAQIDSVLSDSQKPLLQRVEFHRKRASRLEYFTIMIAKAKIDLSYSIEVFDPGVLTPALEKVMWDYEQAITPLFDHLQADSRQAQVDLIVARRERLGPDGQPRKITDLAELQAYQAAVGSSEQAVRTKTLDAQLRIAKINDEFLPKLAAQMSERGAARLKATYLASAYQHVFPDPYDPEALYREVRASPDLNDDLRQLIDEQWSAYRKTYDAICDDMMTESDRWQEQGARTGMADGYEEHNSKMAKWADQRLAKNKEFVKRMAGMLPEEILAQKRKSIQLWQDDNERTLTAEKKSIHPPVDFR
jgi:hypothetical protein